MLENNESKNEIKNIINSYQSFSKNNIFNSIPETNLKPQKKEELINFSFKKNFDKNNATTITTNKEQKINDLSIYSQNDKNIYQSGHFACNKNIKNNNNSNELKHKSKYLIKNLFNDSIALNKKQNNNNKENFDINDNNMYTAKETKDKFFVKIKTKYININSNNSNENIFNKKLNKIKKDLDKSNNRINKSNNSLKSNKKIISKKKVTITTNTSYVNKSFELNEKLINDKLFNKINNINKKLVLFTEYNKKLTRKIRILNKELSSIENYKSKRILKTDKNKNYTMASPDKNKSTIFNSEIRNIIFKKKIRNTKNKKNETSLNHKSKIYYNSNSFHNISEFKILSSKKSKSKNKNKSRNEIFEKSMKKRRVKTNNIFECIHINII